MFFYDDKLLEKPFVILMEKFLIIHIKLSMKNDFDKKNLNLDLDFEKNNIKLKNEIFMKIKKIRIITIVFN